MNGNVSLLGAPNRILGTALPVRRNEGVDLVGRIGDLLVAGVITLGRIKPRGNAGQIWPKDLNTQAASNRGLLGPAIRSVCASTHDNAVGRERGDQFLDR